MGYFVKNAAAVNSGEAGPHTLGVSAIDDTTLQIELEYPFPYITERLLYPIFAPIPRHALERHGANWVKPENWVSNGPYLLADWRPQSHVDLQKNPQFAESDSVRIENARIHPIAEASSAYNRYLAGEVDVTRIYPKELAEELEQERPGEAISSPLQSMMYLVFNTQAEPLSNVAVRRALALAIDRQVITEHVLGNGEIPSNTLSPPVVADYQPIDTEPSPNITVAKELLRDAGFEPGELRLELRHIADAETKNVFVVIAAMWQQIGVEAMLHHSSLPDHFGALNNGDFEVAQAGWFGENNPEHYVELLWSKIPAANYGKYASTEFDRLFELGRQQSDLAKRLAYLRAAESVALGDYAVVPLYVVQTRNLVSPAVGGWRANGRNLHPTRFYYWQ